jgi:hypothetical protein
VTTKGLTPVALEGLLTAPLPNVTASQVLKRSITAYYTTEKKFQGLEYYLKGYEREIVSHRRHQIYVGYWSRRSY